MAKRALKIGMIAATLLLVGASCSAQVATNTNGAISVNTNVNITPEDIIYGTNMSAEFVEESRQDCQDKGGTFNQCGSACKTGEMCIAACTLRCDF